MSSSKKSVDEIWRELNAYKTAPRQGVAGLAVGLSGLPGITSVVRTKPAAPAPTSAAAPATSAVGPTASSNAAVDLAQGPHLATAVGEDAAAYLATLQRTINCLADPDRGLRRSAAANLQSKLFAGDASTPRASPAHLQALLCGPLLRPLVGLLSDSVERCRTVALAILLQAGPQLSDLGPLLPELVPELARRFGAIPVQEPAEEVRLQIIQLVAQLLGAAPPPQLARFVPELAAVLCRALEDGFPDIKKAACSALETASARLPTGSLEPEAERLLTSLAPNLQHQHSRVRLACIQALDALVSAGAPMALVEGTVASTLRPVGHDRAQPVREAAFTALSKWMGYHPGSSGDGGSTAGSGIAGEGNAGGDAGGAGASEAGAGAPAARAYVPSLLPLLLIGVTDPQPATAELALRLVEGVGEAWVGGESGGGAGAKADNDLPGPHAQDGAAPPGDSSRSGSAQSGGNANENTSPGEPATEQQQQQEDQAKDGGRAGQRGDAFGLRVSACHLEPPYSGRPGPGCRAMVRALLRQHLPPLVRQLGEWTTGLRVAAARGLHTTLVMAEEGAAPHLRLLLPALYSAIADEEVEVATRVMACVHVLGAHVDPADWLPRLLDVLSPPGTNSNTNGPQGATQHVAPHNSGNGSGSGDRGTGISSALSTSQRTQTLVVLSGLMHAAGRAQQGLPPALLQRLAGVLAEEGMLAAAAEHPGVRQQLLVALVNLVAWVCDACAEVALPLHVALLQLYGSELAAAPPQPAVGRSGGGRPPVGAPVTEALSRLAAFCGAGAGADTSRSNAIAALTDRHADWLIGALLATTDDTTAAGSLPAPPTGPAWRARPGDATWQCVLRATLRTASSDTVARLAPALVAALRPLVGDKDCEPGLRLAVLQLVDEVLEELEGGKALALAGGLALITDVLMPPLVWQAGKTAAAIRYAAVTALATLLGNKLPDPAHVLAAVEASAAAALEEAAAAAAGKGAGASQSQAAGAVAARRAGGGGADTSGLLPLLFSALDEDWYTDMRLATCYVVEKMLELVGPQLSDASRRALYPELHKRLDDAHNSVRVAACGALRAFVTAAGPGYCDTNSGYLVAGVVIHMDDGDPAVQEAACSVLLAAAATKPHVTAVEVRKVRDRFRSKHYCDRVMAACEGAAITEGAAGPT